MFNFMVYIQYEMKTHENPMNYFMGNSLVFHGDFMGYFCQGQDQENWKRSEEKKEKNEEIQQKKKMCLFNSKQIKLKKILVRNFFIGLKILNQLENFKMV